MSKIYRLLFFIGLSTSCLISLHQKPSSANPFDAINRALGTINSTVNTVNGTVGNTSSTIKNLNGVLGISNNSEDNNGSTTERVLDSYARWYTSISPSEQEIVSWLVLESAKDKALTFNTISSSEWFLQKPLQEQQKIGSLLFKLNQIIKVAGTEKDQFLAFAFCVNSGAKNCSTKGL